MYSNSLAPASPLRYTVTSLGTFGFNLPNGTDDEKLPSPHGAADGVEVIAWVAIVILLGEVARHAAAIRAAVAAEEKKSVAGRWDALRTSAFGTKGSSRLRPTGAGAKGASLSAVFVAANARQLRLAFEAAEEGGQGEGGPFVPLCAWLLQLERVAVNAFVWAGWAPLVLAAVAPVADAGTNVHKTVEKRYAAFRKGLGEMTRQQADLPVADMALADELRANLAAFALPRFRKFHAHWTDEYHNAYGGSQEWRAKHARPTPAELGASLAGLMCG